MNKFTEMINEARKNYDSGSLLSSEISRYLNKVNKIIPRIVLEVITLTQKYGLLDAKSIDEIRNASKGSLNKLSTKYNIESTKLEELWELLKEIKNKIKLLPQYQTPQERESIELGKLSMNDLTIDLDSSQGRNAAAKMYMPMIYKIVNSYVGKSKLSKLELMSAAMQGFTNAMNDWKKPDNKEEKRVVFKTYAGYRVKQLILNDINELSHTLSGTNWYASKKFGGGVLDATSLDNMIGKDEEDYMQDHLAELGEDPNYDLTKSEEQYWDELYKLIEDKFKQRDVDIFYRYFGLHGYKREKSKDIAKSMGMSEGNIRNSIINKMISFLKKDKHADDILLNILDAYNESLMVDMLGMDKELIMETLINDDIYILLEELNKWNNREIFINFYKKSIKDFNNNEINIIHEILSNDNQLLNENLNINKNIIQKFLTNMYPSENISKKSDILLLEYMEELLNAYKKYMVK